MFNKFVYETWSVQYDVVLIPFLQKQRSGHEEEEKEKEADCPLMEPPFDGQAFGSFQFTCTA
jgi:hypothetical protein